MFFSSVVFPQILERFWKVFVPLERVEIYSGSIWLWANILQLYQTSRYLNTQQFSNFHFYIQPSFRRASHNWELAPLLKIGLSNKAIQAFAPQSRHSTFAFCFVVGVGKRACAKLVNIIIWRYEQMLWTYCNIKRLPRGIRGCMWFCGENYCLSSFKSNAPKYQQTPEPQKDVSRNNT